MRYEDFRREYTAGGLHRDSLRPDPFDQFEHWFAEVASSELVDPTAMVLATVDASGAPWQRIVLLKGISEFGLLFYTNYASDKGKAIALESRVALHFPWNALDRQVAVAGHAKRMTREESGNYFATRPRESQVAAWASSQSQPIADRAALMERAEAVRQRFGDEAIPLPDDWGGYRVIPERFEFWQGGEHRLHDRFVYRRQEDESWSIERRQP